MTNGLMGREKEFGETSWDNFVALGLAGQLVNPADLPQLRRALGVLRRNHRVGGVGIPAFTSNHSIADLAGLPDAEIQRLVIGIGPVSTRVLEEALFGLLELGPTAQSVNPQQINVKNL